MCRYRDFSCLHFPVFRLNKEYFSFSVNLPIKSKHGKIQTRIYYEYTHILSFIMWIPEYTDIYQGSRIYDQIDWVTLLDCRYYSTFYEVF